MGGNRVPDSMPTELKDGYTLEMVIAEHDPSKDDPVCEEIQKGVVFFRELKKMLSNLNKNVIYNGNMIEKQKEENKKKIAEANDENSDQSGVKSYKIVNSKIRIEADTLSAFIKLNTESVHVDDLTDALAEFWADFEAMGSDTSKIAKFNTATTKATRGLFKYQTNVMNRLKDRKKELMTAYKASQENAEPEKQLAELGEEVSQKLTI